MVTVISEKGIYENANMDDLSLFSVKPDIPSSWKRLDTVKEFNRFDSDYINIDFDKKLIYGSKTVEVKVNGFSETLNQQVYYIPEKLTLCFYDSDHIPKSISLHSCRGLEDFKTLLALKPDWLDVSYHFSNQSDYMRKYDLDNESVCITGYIKTGKTFKPYSVSFNSHIRKGYDYNAFTHIATF